MAKRIMRSFQMDEFSAVDRPAQKGAKAVILKRVTEDGPDDAEYMRLTKRDFSAEQRRSAADSGAAMPGGRYPIENRSDLENAIHAIGRGKGSHAAIRAHIIRRAKALGAIDALPDGWTAAKGEFMSRDVAALRDTLLGTVTKMADKPEALGTIIALGDAVEKAFKTDAIRADMEKAQPDIDVALGALFVSARDILKEAAPAEQNALLQKSYEEFSFHIQSLMPGAIASALDPTAHKNGDDVMALKDFAKALNLAETATEEDITKALGAALAKAAFADAIEKMSAKHSAFMNKDGAKMPTGGKAAFAAMSADERDKHIAANSASDDDADDMQKMIAKGDAFQTSAGVVMTKKDFGTDAGYQFAKAQNTESVRLAKALGEQEDVNQRAAITKRAETEFPNAGKPAEVAAMLQKVRKADATLGDQVEAVLKSMNTAIEKGELFAEKGNALRGAGSGFEAIDKLAHELMAKDSKLTVEKARSMARTQNPEFAKREADDRKAALKAA